ncbi:glycosyltransferase [Rhodopseudomonas palustris]|uniref:glycosyltransferase family 2 protein n=1 Tax=Rhodopseudomonas palustris TaxID=1076 RepID=UPI0021F255B1|nr:glycosyltransferase family 2 protein [Rhodopseudomonas palustris]UYO45317.1 glycosyltransferase [Rhodopseudomonas palustris]
MANTEPLISVIIPTYNSSAFVARCLESVQNQSIKDIEIIVVDDFSSDGTLDVLKTYSRNDSRIEIIESPRKGMAGGARNLGIDRAKGRYISFIDSDDWIDTDFFHSMSSALDRSGAQIAVSGVKREYDSARSSAVRYKYCANNVIDGRFAISLLSRTLDQDISISSIVCNKLFQASFIKKNAVRFIEGRHNEDDIFTFIAFSLAPHVNLVPEIYYHLFQRRNSSSRSFSKKHIDDLFFAFSCMRERLTVSGRFDSFKSDYYSFFEKCFSYTIESMQISCQDEAVLGEYFKYAITVCGRAILFDEFIDYCGTRRIADFFTMRHA